jgi:hypothetical protein
MSDIERKNINEIDGKEFKIVVGPDAVWLTRGKKRFAMCKRDAFFDEDGNRFVDDDGGIIS